MLKRYKVFKMLWHEPSSWKTTVVISDLVRGFSRRYTGLLSSVQALMYANVCEYLSLPRKERACVDIFDIVQLSITEDEVLQSQELTKASML